MIDAIIDSSVIIDVPLYTVNLKHYEPLPGLRAPTLLSALAGALRLGVLDGD